MRAYAQRHKDTTRFVPDRFRVFPGSTLGQVGSVQCSGTVPRIIATRKTYGLHIKSDLVVEVSMIVFHSCVHSALVHSK